MSVAVTDRLHGRLHRLEVPYEEWEILFRQTLLLERAVLRAGHERARRGAVRLAATLIAAAPLIEEATKVVRETAQDLGIAGRARRRRVDRRSA